MTPGSNIGDKRKEIHKLNFFIVVIGILIYNNNKDLYMFTVPPAKISFSVTPISSRLNMRL